MVEVKHCVPAGEKLCARRRRSTELCLGSCGLAAGVRGEALCVGCGSSVFREAEALCTEEKKHRALPGVRVFYQKISRKIIEALCSITSSVFRKVITMCREGSGSPV